MRPFPRRLLAAPVAAAIVAAGWALTGTAAAAPAAALAHRPAHQAQAQAPADPRPLGHPALQPATTAAVTVTAAAGDSLSSISQRACGHADRWPELWWANRGKVRNPDLLKRGTVLELVCRQTRSSIGRRAEQALPKPPPPAPAPPQQQAPAPAAAPAAPAAQAPAAQTYGGPPGSFEACVIAAESGGNPSAVNPSSGAGGLFQFLPSTWASLGYSGAPQDAPVAEQYAAFDRLYAEAGTSPWAGDGCA